jgi:nucleoid-associated protein YgaU
MDGQKQNNISTLPILNTLALENLFNVYNDGQNYHYNLIGTVNIPESLDQSTYSTFTVTNDRMPWTLISQKAYNTPLLWWLICTVNNIQNPIDYPAAGTVLKILTPDFVSSILQQIKTTN